MKEKRVESNITLEDARLIFKNFAGKQTEFNSEGDRNFGVLLDDELAKELENDGWNVKYLKPREDAEDPEYRQPWLKVKVKYGKIPPIAVLINSRGKIRLDEDNINQLDWTRISNVDLVIRPYNYPATNFSPAGVAAYLKAIYVTVQEDDLESKYANIEWFNGSDDCDYIEE